MGHPLGEAAPAAAAAPVQRTGLGVAGRTVVHRIAAVGRIVVVGRADRIGNDAVMGLDGCVEIRRYLLPVEGRRRIVCQASP